MVNRRPRRRGPQKNFTVIDESKNIISKSVIINSSVNRPNTLVLPVNTDLNSAPSNWLSSATESYGLQNMSTQSGFSSFQMANKFIDNIDKVDIVSDAENIKQLLKIPFSKKSVSMMVHKVGDTFIIDEFDASKHLVVETQQKNWSWLKKFFSEHIFKSGQTDKYISRQVNSFNVIQEKTLNSKFLHYSIADPPNVSKNDNYQQFKTMISEPNSNIPSLPQPLPQDQFPDYPKTHNFNQTILWTFGDVKMLIGSDLPIFKHGTSFQNLRLKNLSKHSKSMYDLPFVDYWLDNLMCNVPEVLLCHHVDGKVKKYEKIKTKDLPNFEDKFLPNNFVYIARNLLSFLKSKVTKVGHTYWLYKGKNDSMITTYDLTTLCFESLPQDQNMFTTPVAMLLYRVAYHFLNCLTGKRKSLVIESLLYNSSKLLNKTDFPMIYASINYMFSELYHPACNDEGTAVKPLLSLLNNDDELDQNDYKPINSIDIFNLYILHKINKSRGSEYTKSKSVEISAIECSHRSLYNVACGLKNIQHLILTAYQQPDKLNTASLSSSELKSNITKVGPKNRYSYKVDKRIIFCPFYEDVAGMWKWQLRILFLEKASLVCLLLSANDFSLDKYGACMKRLRLLYECQIHIFGTNIDNPLNYFLYQQIGRCYFRIAKSWDDSKKYKTEFENVEDHELIIIDFLENECKHDPHENLKFITCNFELKSDVFKIVEYYFIKSLELTVITEDKNIIKKELCEAYIEHVSHNKQYLLNAIKNSTKLILSEFEEIMKTSEEYFDFEISIINKKYEAYRLLLLYKETGVIYNLAYVYLLKCNPEYRHHFEENLEKNASKYLNESYEILIKNRSNLVDLDSCYCKLFESFNSVALQFVSLYSYVEVQNVEVLATYWIKKALYCYDLINNVTTRRLYLHQAATIKNHLGDLHFKKLKQCVQNNMQENLSMLIKFCMKQYREACSMYLLLNYPFKVLEIINQQLLLEEIQMIHGLKTKIDCIIAIFENLGIIANLLCKTSNHELFFNQNIALLIEVHGFNQAEYFNELENHLKFVLKHMVKVSKDETSALATKKDEIKTIYFTLIKKKAEDNYTNLLKTMCEIHKIKLQ